MDGKGDSRLAVGLATMPEVDEEEGRRCVRCQEAEEEECCLGGGLASVSDLFSS